MLPSSGVDGSQPHFRPPWRTGSGAGRDVRSDLCTCARSSRAAPVGRADRDGSQISASSGVLRKWMKPRMVRISMIAAKTKQVIAAYRAICPICQKA